MIRFECDYTTGAHPKILEALVNTNGEAAPGYGVDIHCERACDIILEGAARYGAALEYNANGFRRGLHRFVDGERYQYPLERFWDQVRDAHIDVYVGSDCHDPGQVYDEFVELAFEKKKEKAAHSFPTYLI